MQQWCRTTGSSTRKIAAPTDEHHVDLHRVCVAKAKNTTITRQRVNFNFLTISFLNICVPFFRWYRWFIYCGIQFPSLGLVLYSSYVHAKPVIYSTMARTFLASMRTGIIIKFWMMEKLKTTMAFTRSTVSISTPFIANNEFNNRNKNVAKNDHKSKSNKHFQTINFCFPLCSTACPIEMRKTAKQVSFSSFFLSRFALFWPFAQQNWPANYRIRST